MAFKFDLYDLVEANDVDNTHGRVTMRDSGRPNRYVLDNGKVFGEDQLKLVSKDNTKANPKKKWWQ